VAARDWDADAATAELQPARWSGHAWRFHRQRYEATDHSGSLLVSGRYHRAPDQFAPEHRWPALYLALAPEVAIGEVLRHVEPSLLPDLNGFRISELTVDLGQVLDCRDAGSLGLQDTDLIRDYDFATTQALASAVLNSGAEAMLVRSATALGENLIVFPSNLKGTSRITVVSSRDARLYVKR
jgi:hypothetical protein